MKTHKHDIRIVRDSKVGARAYCKDCGKEMFDNPKKQKVVKAWAVLWNEKDESLFDIESDMGGMRIFSKRKFAENNLKTYKYKHKIVPCEIIYQPL
jgi:hypothetical protein